MTKEPTTFSKVIAMTMKLIKLDEGRRMRCDDDKAPFKKDERLELEDPDRVQCPNFRNLAKGFRREIERYTRLNALRS